MLERLNQVGVILLLSMVACQSAVAETIRVGPGLRFSTPSAAAAVATEGDVVEIVAGTYRGDVAVWRANNLTLKGVGGLVRLRADGQAAEDKAIWVIKGNNTFVESIEFSGAAVPDKNGAGIRQEGTNLTVLRCRFSNNENGILTGADPDSHIQVLNSLFDSNGHGDGYSHNIYVGRVARFTLESSYLQRAKIGHQVKSRAVENEIRYNKIMDGVEGTSSYLIDLPNPGRAIVVGNVLQQGRRAENRSLIHSVQELYLVNNTLVNQRSVAIFLLNKGSADNVVVANNIFAGGGTPVSGGANEAANVIARSPGFRNAAFFDYHLMPGSPAIDAGIKPEAAAFDMLPRREYRPIANSDPRSSDGRLDAGAFEFVDTQLTR